jgi:protein-S-isoprenylcysteine O-methyltransferase Ste14
MDPWFGKAVVLAGAVAIVAIRAPHGQRSRGVRVAASRKGTLEIVLLTIAWFGFFLPLFWVVKGVPQFADYPLHPAAFAAGIACTVAGLWLFHRSHKDLGTNWSITLQIRESHSLVTHGVYRTIRHPMYTSLLLVSLGQALAVPNWVAGLSYMVAIVLLVALRLGPEERMMLETFGPQYETYRARTKRLVPGVL